LTTKARLPGSDNADERKSVWARLKVDQAAEDEDANLDSALLRHGDRMGATSTSHGGVVGTARLGLLAGKVHAEINVVVVEWMDGILHLSALALAERPRLRLIRTRAAMRVGIGG
jgi:hypothetical protein